jgi:hypothetical protein
MVLGMGCATEADVDVQDGNEALGIASFVVDETADKSTVVGYSAAGDEVARLDLIHGVFTLSPYFALDYDTPVVNGRKLDANFGRQRIRYETAGFDPLFKLPPQGPSEAQLTAFLDDPHVKLILDRWQLGFRHAGDDVSIEGESAYTAGSYAGTDPWNCTGYNFCGSVRNDLPIGICGDVPSAAKSVARVTTNWYNPSNGTYVDQVRMAQCCYAYDDTPGNVDYDATWYAIKTCPTSGTTSECGTGSTACKACTQHFQTDCDVSVDFTYSIVSWMYTFY